MWDDLLRFAKMIIAPVGCILMTESKTGIFAVDEIEAVKAHRITKIQSASISDPQLLQFKALNNNWNLRISITVRIWFGTRGSEVQILSPRPLFSIT